MSVKYRPSVGRVAVKYRLGVGRHACRLMSVDMSVESRPTYRPSIGRDIGRLSVDISADTIDRYSVDRCLKFTCSENDNPQSGKKGNR